MSGLKMAVLHSTLTQAAFVVATTFHFSSTTVAFASTLSQHSLSMLDSILGSTESSRAIASIVTLIRREFRNPMTGVKGERVGLRDLLIGAVGFVLLQRWARKTTEREIRERGAEEVIWDVVTLRSGMRTDRVRQKLDNEDPSNGVSRYRSRIDPKSRMSRHSSYVSVTGDGAFRDVVYRRDDAHGQEDILEADTEQYIREQLPPYANVTVTSKTVTTRAVVVDISGTAVHQIIHPPGMIAVKTTVSGDNFDVDEGSPGLVMQSTNGPRYRIVYQVVNSRPQGVATADENQLRLQDASERYAAQNPVRPGAEDLQSPESMTARTFPTSTSIGPENSWHIMEVDSPAIKTDQQRGSDADRIERTELGSSDLAEQNGMAKKGSRIQANEGRPRGLAMSSGPLSGSVMSKLSTSRLSLAKFMPGNSYTSAEKPTMKSSFRRPLTSKRVEDESQSAPSSRQRSTEPESLPGFSFEKAQTDAQVQLDEHLVDTGSLPISKAEPFPTPQASTSDNVSSRLTGKREASKSPSRCGHSNHRKRRSSTVSQPDPQYSGYLDGSGPGSPTSAEGSPSIERHFTRISSAKDVVVSDQAQDQSKALRRSRSLVPSIYTLRTNDSETSLVLAEPMKWNQPYEQAVTQCLLRTGRFMGSFPQAHFVRNVTRFVRFASASYGSHFLRIMGLVSSSPKLLEYDSTYHYEHRSFSRHARLAASTILLSSFVDPQGGTNAAGETDTGLPLVHFISLDHESKAVVLTIRGTLGFEDVLTDMACEYDDLYWRGTAYKVHKGIHASTRRLLHGNGRRVVATIQAALEEFSEYGLVLCGHSLGGAVAALLAIMISERSTTDWSASAFVTAPQSSEPQSWLDSSRGYGRFPSPQLPPGRPVHAYAYGPPATVSPQLRLATRGLITTIINGQDVVPSLSLGVLNDTQAIALAFKTDRSNAKGEVRGRVWQGLVDSLRRRWHDQRAGGLFYQEDIEREADDEETEEGDDQWAFSALKSLRASMVSAKLLPPGNIFIIETQPVLQRDASVRHGRDHDNADNTTTTGGSRHASSSSSSAQFAKPATRAVLKYIKDVDDRFREVRFGASMLTDHNPGRYESSLAALSAGVLGVDLDDDNKSDEDDDNDNDEEGDQNDDDA